jgi:hypothetical protein
VHPHPANHKKLGPTPGSEQAAARRHRRVTLRLRPIAERVSAGTELGQDGSDLFVRENFCLFAESHRNSMKVIRFQS